MSRNYLFIFYFYVYMLGKPAFFDVTEHDSWKQGWTYIVGKTGFFWCHGTQATTTGFFHPLGKPAFFDVTELCSLLKSQCIGVGKTGFFWCHGTLLYNCYFFILRWENRLFLMSRNYTPSHFRCLRWENRLFLMSRNEEWYKRAAEVPERLLGAGRFSRKTVEMFDGYLREFRSR